jgi:hypothetical protein
VVGRFNTRINNNDAPSTFIVKLFSASLRRGHCLLNLVAISGISKPSMKFYHAAPPLTLLRQSSALWRAPTPRNARCSASACSSARKTVVATGMVVAEVAALAPQAQLHVAHFHHHQPPGSADLDCELVEDLCPQCESQCHTFNCDHRDETTTFRRDKWLS